MTKNKYFEVTWKNRGVPTIGMTGAQMSPLSYFYGKDIKDAMSNAGLGEADMNNINTCNTDVTLPADLKEVVIVKSGESIIADNPMPPYMIDVKAMYEVKSFPFNSCGPLENALRATNITVGIPQVPTDVSFPLLGIERHYRIHNEATRLICQEL